MFKLAVILIDIRSTHNVGSILRSAEGFGATEVLYAGYTPYPQQSHDSRLPHEALKITKQIQKTALGAETLPAHCFTSGSEAIEYAVDNGYQIASLEQDPNSIPLAAYKPTGNIALLVGNEVSGISDEHLQASHVILEIPMKGNKESFNVSVAAGIALYHLSGASHNAA